MTAGTSTTGAMRGVLVPPVTVLGMHTTAARAACSACVWLARGVGPDVARAGYIALSVHVSPTQEARGHLGLCHQRRGQRYTGHPAREKSLDCSAMRSLRDIGDELEHLVVVAS